MAVAVAVAVAVAIIILVIILVHHQAFFCVSRRSCVFLGFSCFFEELGRNGRHGYPQSGRDDSDGDIFSSNGPKIICFVQISCYRATALPYYRTVQAISEPTFLADAPIGAYLNS